MKSFTPIFQDDILIDIETNINERPVRMLGKAGVAREEAILAPLKNHESPDNADGVLPVLPVLLGAGLGHALKALLAITKGPIAVVERESDLLSLSKVREKHTDPRIFWVIAPEAAPPKAILKALIMWQVKHEDKPFALLAHPFYQRVDAWYKDMRQHINNSQPQPRVWENARQPRFTKSTTRILFLASNSFFLCGITSACEQCKYEYEILHIKDLFHNQKLYMFRLLQKITDYKPDYLITINHSGVDCEGVLASMLERMQIPMVSWFVDSPDLIIGGYFGKAKGFKSPWFTIFTWDADTVPTVKALGHKHVFHLPLGTNPEQFYPRPKNERLCDAVCRDITFVGCSGVLFVNHFLKDSACPRILLRHYKSIARSFSKSPEHSVDTFLRSYSPELAAAFDTLPPKGRLFYENAISWGATQQYRKACIEALLPFNPLIIGDEQWRVTLKHAPKTWEFKPRISYEHDLPRVYPYSTINFNCTSKLMKGAVNQRVFDVPAAGSFVLSDWQEQMDDLLERDKEIIVYHEIEEIPELIHFYLKNDTARKTIISAGRKRVLGEHTWAHRLQTMTEKMKDIYGA